MLLLVFCSLSVYAAQPVVTIEAGFPNQVRISWEPVQGADYYDVYVDGEAFGRIRAFATTVGSNEKPLQSHRTYTLTVAARKEGNVELGAAAVKATTTGWEGEYQWLNMTKKDNKGKAKQLDFVVGYENGSYTIDAWFDRLYRIYPVLPESRMNEERSYNGESEEELAYRTNASVFNTTNMTPTSWSVRKVETSASGVMVEVVTKVGGLSFKTRTEYRFLLSEDGKKELHFKTKGDGIASWGIFSSPNPGENGVFILREIE